MNRLEKIIKIEDLNEYGVYLINLYKNGIECQVIVDDYIPCINNETCFSKSIRGQNLFMLILEKAYAKLHGSYLRLEGGLAF